MVIFPTLYISNPWLIHFASRSLNLLISLTYCFCFLQKLIIFPINIIFKESFICWGFFLSFFIEFYTFFFTFMIHLNFCHIQHGILILILFTFTECSLLVCKNSVNFGRLIFLYPTILMNSLSCSRFSSECLISIIFGQ